ncbi:RDD family protein [Halomonas sp. KO116]|uniref:RDD family protein n=1 Tax=Halomonas sp. KO116 TaxID=1504981 RepID=UPI0004E2C62B|nr:RDD family protein [Halomonas sp. KO116]AJY53220.1 RDD domain containing protein [Halomonas sp. KO116]
MNEVGNASELEYVGFGSRLWASIIDCFLLLLVTIPILNYFYGSDYWVYWLLDGSSQGTFDFVMTWVFPAIGTLLFWTYHKATPGKMAISAKIVDQKTGQAAGLDQLAIRYIAYFISAIPMCLGFIWIAFDPRKQGLHDKIAGTVVVRNKNHQPTPVRFGK